MVLVPAKTARRSVEVNEDVCERVAVLLKNRAIPKDREEIQFSGFSGPETSNLLFSIVAICHQTSVPGRRVLQSTVEGRVVRGWDYLLQKYVEAAREDRSLITAARWATITAEDLRIIFRTADGEDLLEGLDDRAALIRDLGHTLLANGWQTLHDVYVMCDGWIETAKPNLLLVLKGFRAYRDPVKKKSFFLLSLMRNAGIWTFKDPERLGPPVDYHEVRGHLRVGTVSIVDEELKGKLLRGTPVSTEEDIELRSAVLEAIMWLSERTGLQNPSQLHYLFWNVFRNYCTREQPNCLGLRRETYLPDRYQQLAVRNGAHQACPFSPVCRSINVTERLVEHVFETDFY